MSTKEPERFLAQKRTYKNVIHNFTSSTTTKSKQKNMKKKTKLSLNLAA
jgi:hypothetical protein